MDSLIDLNANLNKIIFMKKILIVLLLFFNFSNPAFAGGASLEGFFIDNSASESNNTSLNNTASNNTSLNLDSNKKDSKANDSEIIIKHKQAFCARNVKKPKLAREMSPNYFLTYFGGIINAQSLGEFFNITNNQYHHSCDSWFRKYYSSQFHKALVFAHDPKNMSNISSYWGFSQSDNSLHRLSVEQNALKNCNASTEKKESHICSILFSNNTIVNEEYLSLAKQITR